MEFDRLDAARAVLDRDATTFDSPPDEFYAELERSAKPTAQTRANSIASVDPLDWLQEYEMTHTETEQLSDPEWVEAGLIVRGHLIIVAAKPNGGKTTIFFDYGRKWAQRQYVVVYVHADTNPSDAKGMWEAAQSVGMRYLTPDLKVGKSMSDVVERLKLLAKSSADLTGQIWIFDTLKKMGNVINKAALRELLMTLRKLSARGMTVIALAHTNKYKNSDGEYQYEGTGDLEADVDELIYLEPRENPDGTVTVSTRCTKRRANISQFTWDIHVDRTVTQRDDYLDIPAEAQATKQREKDQPVIEAITECLSAGSKKQTEVIAHCQQIRMSEKRVRAVLKSYSGKLWKAEKLFENNAWRYQLPVAYASRERG